MSTVDEQRVAEKRKIDNENDTANGVPAAKGAKLENGIAAGDMALKADAKADKAATLKENKAKKVVDDGEHGEDAEEAADGEEGLEESSGGEEDESLGDEEDGGSEDDEASLVSDNSEGQDEDGEAGDFGDEDDEVEGEEGGESEE
ncbi:unnamed protein product [Gongylonema pulchrum]|uniref:Prothymosin alpha n=1 Tax=Gongylonema pulchrum TaxID=637853 RepID=A0A183E7L9_9BILA|nr:unnamed protein product [Gongylonema pulchrum]